MKIKNLLVSTLTLSSLFIGIEINSATAQTIRFKGEREMAQECISIAARVYSQAYSSSMMATNQAKSFCRQGGDPYCLVQAYQNYSQQTSSSLRAVREAESSCR